VLQARPDPSHAGYYGVEWDLGAESHAGKYDGSYKGRRFFQCAEGAGSFVTAGVRHFDLRALMSYSVGFAFG
jgi:dynactin complex subunit